MKQSKINITHLLRRNKATSTSDLRPSHSLSSLQSWKAVSVFTWGITSCFIITLCLHRTRAFHYRTHYNQWCCLHWMGHDKSPTVNCCRVLYITYWHKFQIIFNSHFVLSGVDTVPSFVPNTFSSFVFYLPFLSFCHRSAQLIPVVHWALSPLESRSWPLLLIGLKFVLVLGPTQFSKAFKKKYIPHHYLMEMLIHFTQTYSLKMAILGNQNHFSELLYLHSKQEKTIVPSQTSNAFACFLVTLYFEVQFSPFIQSGNVGTCFFFFLYIKWKLKELQNHMSQCFIHNRT